MTASAGTPAPQLWQSTPISPAISPTRTTSSRRGPSWDLTRCAPNGHISPWTSWMHRAQNAGYDSSRSLNTTIDRTDSVKRWQDEQLSILRIRRMGSLRTTSRLVDMKGHSRSFRRLRHREQVRCRAASAYPSGPWLRHWRERPEVVAIFGESAGHRFPSFSARSCRMPKPARIIASWRLELMNQSAACDLSLQKISLWYWENIAGVAAIFEPNDLLGVWGRGRTAARLNGDVSDGPRISACVITTQPGGGASGKRFSLSSTSRSTRQGLQAIRIAFPQRTAYEYLAIRHSHCSIIVVAAPHQCSRRRID